MKINFAHLCDYGTISKEGKLSVLGIFSNINTAKLPSVHPQMFVAFELEIPAAQVGHPIKLRIECIDQDGQKVFGLDGAMESKVKKPAASGAPPVRSAQLLQFNNTKFLRDGPHDIHFFVNDELKHTIQFVVTYRPPAPDAR